MASLYLTQDFRAEEFLGSASTVLLLLAGAVLIYRSFRGRYLLAWILGWVAYLAHKFATGVSVAHPVWSALASGAYVLAIALFGASILYYTNHRKRLLPLAVLTAVALEVVVIRTLWFPASLPWMAASVVLYTAMRTLAAAHLAIFTWGRRRMGPWLLVVSLVLLHMHDDPGTAHAVAAYDLLLELLLGLSMLMIVLDDSQDRARRLRVLNQLTTAIAQAQEAQPVIQTALHELKALMDAPAAWFRALQDGHLVLAQHIGLSEDYVFARKSVSVESSFSGTLLKAGRPGVVRARTTDAPTRHRLESQGFDHVLIVPLKGKHERIGTLALGMARRYHYTTDEMHFFASGANQLGIAIENQRLLQQILHSQKQWVATFDSMEDSVLVHDDRFRIIKVNRAMLERLGKAVAEVAHRTCEEALPRVGEAWQAWQGCPYCWRDVTNFGEAPDPCFGGFSQVSTSSYSEQGNETMGTIHIIKDITDRLAAEERYRRFFEQVHEGVFVSSPEGKLLECNDAFARMLGYPRREEVMAVDIARDLYVLPQQRDEFRRQMEQHGHVRNYEVMLRRKDGSPLAALETSFATRNPQGNIVNYQGFLLDITEKKRIEDEMRRRNRELASLNAIAVTANQSFDLDEILRVALEQVMDLFAADTGAVYLLDEHSGVLRRRAAQGHRSQLAADLPEVRLPAEFWEQMRRSRTQVITHQHLAQLPAFVGEFVRTEGLQSWIWVLLWAKDKIVGVLGVSSRTAREFSATDESLLVAVGRQLATTIEKVSLYEETRRAYDDLSRAQEQLLQSEKMSAVGQLISGVSHELNNPLTAILGYAQLLESETLGERSQDFVHKIYKQAQRTHKIVQNLLSFSRQRKPEKERVDLREVLEETLGLRDYDLRLNNVAVTRQYDAEVAEVVADPHQLEQVFLNILNNAVDAMLEKGRGGSLNVHVYQQGGQVCAEVRDSGPGIREVNRIFDPFYTTKSVGKGTGLGLSICYGIVKEHGGEIRAHNHPQGGAVFTVALPPVAAATAAPAPFRREPAALHGRVLLVDDEEAVLDFEREALETAGAKVTAVPGGSAALDRLQHEHYDALIVDGHMAGAWTGIDLYRWVQEHRPELLGRFLLAISNPNDTEIKSFVERTGVAWIAKPFQVEELKERVRRVLAKTSSVPAD